MNGDVLNELALLRELGYTHLDLSRPVVEAASLRVDESSSRHEEETSTPRRLDDSASPFDLLRLETHDCTRCRLAGSRKNVVFGVGNPNADLMFIGEAPGRDEDEQGEPFVGRAGQLLTDIIKAMKLTRDDVYIANVIKCRPPENRNPEADELDACRPFIRRQVELIKPKVIVTLGRFGLQSLTEKGYGISAVRGKWLEYNGIKLMPTYHPAYLLRNPAAKKDVWADMKKVMAELGIA
ncbi:MAG TPA: uracil-DNA glycosylase [Thermoanaerobaculia bacterium]